MNGSLVRRPSFRLASVVAAGALLSACSGADSGSDPASQGGAASGGVAASGGSSAPNGGSTANGGSSGGASSGGSGSGGASSGGTNGLGGMAAGGTSGASAGGSGSGGKSTGGASAMGGKSSGAGGSNTASGGKSSGGAASGGTSGNTGGAATGGSKSSGGSGGSGGTGGGACPFTGHVTYTLAKAANPTQTEQTAYDLITKALDKAISYYNCYTDITKSLNVSYVPSVSTADGNINGSMRFGSNTTYMDYRTAMHEIGHTVGIGQASNWGSFITDGIFTGTNANAQLQAIFATLPSPPSDTKLHADTQHFWPYGINQQSEVKSEADLLNHCKMVMAIRKDLGLK